MENASKALIIVASVLIGIMLLSFMVYMFKRFNTTAKDTDTRLEERTIEEINSKFVGYETGSHSLDDIYTITYARQNAGGSVVSNNYKYKELFGTASNPSKTITNDEDYRKSLRVAAQDLNNVSDVVSAINDAIDVNSKNSNNYLYNSVEIQNSVEIIVDLGEKEYKDFNFNKVAGTTTQFQNLIIEPNRNVKAKYVYGFNKMFSGQNVLTGMTKKTRAQNLVFENDKTKSGFNAVKVYDMLKELRDTKLIQDGLKSYTVYKYYFFGTVNHNSDTGLIDSITFNLVKDYSF